MFHGCVGMQHIVECICAGPHEKRHYLCTLCKLTVTTNQIIKHVLSFDHIYWYFVSNCVMKADCIDTAQCGHIGFIGLSD